MPDWGWIIIAVAVVFGASKLPDIARNLGRSSGEFKKGLKEGNEGMPEAEAEATTPDGSPAAAAPPPAAADAAPGVPRPTTPTPSPTPNVSTPTEPAPDEPRSENPA
jgi:sec-independent protein translocase protein TatA